MLNRRKAFTLIEALVVVAVISTLMIVLVTTFLFTHQGYGQQTSIGQLQLSGRQALARMVRQSAQALAVVESHDSYTSDNDTLILRLPAIAIQSQGEPQQSDPCAADPEQAKNDRWLTTVFALTQNCTTTLENTYDYIIFELEGDRLKEIIIADPASDRQSGSRSLSNFVDSFSITYYDDDGTQITDALSQTKRAELDLEASETHFGKQMRVNFSEHVTLRNQ